MRRAALAFLFGGILLTSTVPAFGQATTEAGLGAAASSMGAAGSQGVGNGIKGILGNLEKTLNPGGSKDVSKTEAPATTRTTTKSRRTVRKAAPVGQEAALPAPVYEDAVQIEKGMAYDDVVRRFGPPTMQIASGSEAQTLTYVSPRGSVQVECQGGQVVSVAKPKSGA